MAAVLAHFPAVARDLTLQQNCRIEKASAVAPGIELAASCLQDPIVCEHEDELDTEYLGTLNSFCSISSNQKLLGY